MKRFILLIILAISLMGCSHYRYTHRYMNEPMILAVRVIPIWIDDEFSRRDKEEIGKGIEEWNYALNGHIRFIVSGDRCGDKCWKIYKIKSWEDKVKEEDKIHDSHGILGWAMMGMGEIYLVRDRMDDDQVFGVTMHEVGHLLSKGEHAREYLMQPYFHWRESRCIDYNALSMVAETQGLQMGDLNYCVYY
jgi:hypothetical protein